MLQCSQVSPYGRLKKFSAKSIAHSRAVDNFSHLRASFRYSAAVAIINGLSLPNGSLRSKLSPTKNVYFYCVLAGRKLEREQNNPQIWG